MAFWIKRISIAWVWKIIKKGKKVHWKHFNGNFSAALRATVIEGKGDCCPTRLAEYQKVMRNLWGELSDLADFDRVSINFVKFRRWHVYCRHINWHFSSPLHPYSLLFQFHAKCSSNSFFYVHKEQRNPLKMSVCLTFCSESESDD